MQTLDAPSIISLGLAAIGAIFWFARLEGRVNTAEQRHADLKGDVAYIRDRIDDALSK